MSEDTFKSDSSRLYARLLWLAWLPTVPSENKGFSEPGAMFSDHLKAELTSPQKNDGGTASSNTNANDDAGRQAMADALRRVGNRIHAHIQKPRKTVVVVSEGLTSESGTETQQEQQEQEVPGSDRESPIEQGPQLDLFQIEDIVTAAQHVLRGGRSDLETLSTLSITGDFDSWWKETIQSASELNVEGREGVANVCLALAAILADL
ncbi:hypothetical protein CONLIGDRAFT_700156 [Coniochaeta ligniaria NRRL 30616]|uniref:Uncharacterized protein n=1 Tax=Coniochaeta ligniaria NRRL 30616 TaxID=1408157 RepID=A0A1J7ITW0_9PEZI|nr:hypothetical protein CONLIGDRAFT_700156 [Coniochaeta ligniaria NRRL 30616]